MRWNARFAPRSKRPTDFPSCLVRRSVYTYLIDEGSTMTMGRTDSLTVPAVKLPRGFKRLKAACRVPASAANLGPGFDCLGLALGLFNEMAVELAGAKDHVEVIGEGAGELPTGSTNLVIQSMHQACEHLGRKPVPFQVRCHNRIPLQRGLGSSSAAIV